jgi:catechol 2,3-dioxygenase-like lactoylglutathione lyase family enzyme
MKIAIIAAAACLCAAAAAFAQPPAPAAPTPKAAPLPVTGSIAPMPETLQPNKVSGSGITVTDLEGMKTWYETVLGMHTVRTLERNGAPYEYILATSPTRGPNDAILALIRGTRQPGATTYGRFILNVANADATAEFLRTHGVAVRRVAAGAYFLSDPEGNQVEIYQPGS